MYLQVIVAERGPLVWVFNFSPFSDYEGYKVGAPTGGIYRVVLDSDEAKFGGAGRVGHGVDHFTQIEGTPGEIIYSQCPLPLARNPYLWGDEALVRHVVGHSQGIHSVQRRG